MSYSDYGLPSDFDPSLQVLNYTSVYGDTSITFQDIDAYVHILLTNTAIFAVRIGACILAMLSLFIISRNRKTPVFILNQTCLFLVILHSAFYLSYLFDNFGSVVFEFTQFDSLITQNNINVTIAANFFQFLLILFVEGSLVFQVRTIFKADPSLNGKRFGLVCTVLALVTGVATTVLYFYNFVKASIQIYHDPSSPYHSSALNAQPILFASSINFMSLLLIGKLIMAIRSRRYLGLKQFDGFHILLIMTSQSMILPSVLLIISYAVDAWSSYAIPPLSLLLVALSLPLSSMWASSANNSAIPTSTGYHVYTPSSYKTQSYYSEHGGAATLKGSDMMSNKDEIDQSNLYTPSTVAEEEAKRYWFGTGGDADGVDEDDAFVARTTHQITSSRAM